MELLRRLRGHWSLGVALVVLCLVASACRVEVSSEQLDVSSEQVAQLAPPTGSLIRPVEPAPDLLQPFSPTPTVAVEHTAEPTAPPAPTATPIPPPPPTPTPTPTPTPVPILDAAARMGPLNVRLNFWIIHRGASVAGSSFRDLYRTHAWTGETEQLTEHGDMGAEVALSPDGKWLAYFVEGGFRTRSLHVMDVTLGTSSDMGEVSGGRGYVSWSPDSREVLVNHSEGDDPAGAIHAISIDDGSRRTLIESSNHWPSNAVLVAENDLVLWEITNDSTRMVRRQLDTGELIAEAPLSTLGYREYDAANQVLYLTEGREADGSVLAVDLSQGGLDITEVPTPRGEESYVAVSPDGTRVAYVNGDHRTSNELYFVDLLDPTAALLVTADFGGAAMVRGVKWAPASTALVFGYGRPDKEGLVVVGQDGTIRQIGVPGHPLAIVPDGS